VGDIPEKEEDLIKSVLNDPEVQACSCHLRIVNHASPLQHSHRPSLHSMLTLSRSTVSGVGNGLQASTCRKSTVDPDDGSDESIDPACELRMFGTRLGCSAAAEACTTETCSLDTLTGRAAVFCREYGGSEMRELYAGRRGSTART